MASSCDPLNCYGLSGLSVAIMARLFSVISESGVTGRPASTLAALVLKAGPPSALCMNYIHIVINVLKIIP